MRANIHSGAREDLFGEVLGLLNGRSANDIVVFGAGVIPIEDAKLLKHKG